MEADLTCGKSGTKCLQDSPNATAVTGEGAFFFFCFFLDSYEDMRICSFLPPHWSLPRNKEHSLAKLMLAPKLSGFFFPYVFML